MLAEDAYRRGFVHGVAGLKGFLTGASAWHDELTAEYLAAAVRLRNDPDAAFSLEDVTLAAVARAESSIATDDDLD